jgi:hypothetical protein
MKIRAIFGCLMLGGLAVVGCSGSDDQPDPYATVPQFCEAWGSAACTSTPVSRCAGTDSASADQTAACVASQRKFCESLFVGVTGYSSRYADTCLGAVRNAYSDGSLSAAEIATVRHRGEPCNRLIKGPQGVGESCTSDDDCNTLDEYLCVLKAGVGTCQIPEPVPNGDACDAPAASCNPGYYCDDSNCVASKAAGKACAASFECKTGLVCDADSAKCAERVSQTECTTDADCTTNVCDIPTGADTGRCVNSIVLTSSTATCVDLR